MWRRLMGTTLAESGCSSQTMRIAGAWSSDSVSQRYINESLRYKNKIAKSISYQNANMGDAGAHNSIPYKPHRGMDIDFTGSQYLNKNTQHNIPQYTFNNCTFNINKGGDISCQKKEGGSNRLRDAVLPQQYTSDSTHAEPQETSISNISGALSTTYQANNNYTYVKGYGLVCSNKRQYNYKYNYGIATLPPVSTQPTQSAPVKTPKNSSISSHGQVGTSKHAGLFLPDLDYGIVNGIKQMKIDI